MEDDPVYFATFFIVLPGSVAALVVYSVAFPASPLSRALLRERGPCQAPTCLLRAALIWFASACGLIAGASLGFVPRESSLAAGAHIEFIDHLLATIDPYSSVLGLISFFLAFWALARALYCLTRDLYNRVLTAFRGHRIPNRETAP